MPAKPSGTAQSSRELVTRNRRSTPEKPGTDIKNLRAVLMDFPVSHPQFDNLRFRSPDSILGYDIVAVDLKAAFSTYLGISSRYKGLPSLTETESSEIVNDCRRRFSEFNQLLNEGGTLIVLTPPPINCFIDTSDRTYSGTGRNQKTTILLKSFDFLAECLPISIKLTTGRGKNIAFTDHQAAVPFKALEDFLYHEALLEGQNLPLAHIRGKRIPVAALIKVGRGNIIMLPMPREEHDFPDESAWLHQYGLFLNRFRPLHAIVRPSGDDELLPWANAVRTEEETREYRALQTLLEDALKAPSDN